MMNVLCELHFSTSSVVIMTTYEINRKKMIDAGKYKIKLYF